MGAAVDEQGCHLHSQTFSTGLGAALNELGRGLEKRGGPTVALEVDLATAERLPLKVKITIFRIAQEALTNVVKHADAEAVRIVFVRGERSVRLTIDDDGRGFTPVQPPRGRFGLVGIRERSASVNGTLDIESEPGAGTRLTVEIPLPTPPWAVTIV